MKRRIFLIAALAGATVCLQTAGAQTTASASTSSTLYQAAKEGQPVQVVINRVKADKRQQFEKFVHEVFWPMANKLSPNEQRLFQQTRVLHPVQPEADGTYSYVFIMDPLIEGGNYNIEALLEKMYGAEKGAKYMKLFRETLAGEQTQLMLVQGRYY